MRAVFRLHSTAGHGISPLPSLLRNTLALSAKGCTASTRVSAMSNISRLERRRLSVASEGKPNVSISNVKMPAAIVQHTYHQACCKYNNVFGGTKYSPLARLRYNCIPPRSSDRSSGQAQVRFRRQDVWRQDP